MLNALPGLMQEGAWYSRPTSGTGRTYLGDGGKEAAVRMEFDGNAKQWVPTAYDQYPNRVVTPGPGRTTNLACFTSDSNSIAQPGGTASIDDVLSLTLVS